MNIRKLNICKISPLIFAPNMSFYCLGSPPSTEGMTVTNSLTDGGQVSSTLSVASVNRQHAAVYTCQAANTFGSDVRTYFVNVVGENDNNAM